MDREITLSVYLNRFDTSSKPVKKRWSEWAAELCDLKVSTDKDTFCFVLGNIPAGRTHSNREVEYIDAIGLDLDDLTEVELLETLFSLQGYEHVWYTSHSHQPPEKIKTRVILPLESRIRPEDFNEYWEATNRLVGGRNDPQTKNIGRLFYAHSCPSERIELAQSHHNEGTWISKQVLEDTLRQVTETVPTQTTRPTSARLFALTKEALLVEGRNRARRSDVRERVIGNMLKAVGNGESFADKGDRESARFELCQMIAEKWPDQEEEHVAELFRDSLKEMHKEAPFKNGLDKTVKEIAYKLKRAKTYHQEQQEKREAKRRDEQALINYAARGDGLDTPYSEEELLEMASKLGCHVSELKKLWVLYKDGVAYFLNRIGYQGPISKVDVRSVAATYLSPVPNANAYTPPSRGRLPTLKGYNEICAQYGTKIDNIEASLNADVSSFNLKDKTFVEATAPKSPHVKPKRHENVHRWLQLMTTDQQGKLLDWIAAVPRLDKQCCALYLWGYKGTGKTLLASGLSKIWGMNKTTPLDSVVDGFNGRIAQMPLVVADEYLPDVKNISGKLRELIGNSSHSLKRKYLPEASVSGCVRLIVLANTPNLLDLKGDHTKEDLEAIAQRFLFIQTDKKAATFLEGLPSEEKEFFLEKGIAEHCLWLSENWMIEEGKRFLVEGDLGDANLNISINNEATALICEWIVEYLNNVDLLESNPKLRGLVQIDDGELWVNSTAIQKGWSLYMDGNSLSSRAIGIALRTISFQVDDKNDKRKRVDGKNLRFWRMDLELISSWSEDHGRMSHEDISHIVGSAPF